MSDTQSIRSDAVATASFEERVDQVIAEYLEAEHAGNAPAPDELLARHPDLADGLRAFFSDRDCFVKLAGPVGNTRPTPPRQAGDTTVDVGRYVGLETHARGALGEVFTAEDTELHRTVALKRMQEHLLGDLRSRRRFLVEAEITARLEHPGVAPIYSLYHDAAGRPCYAMRFIEGRTFADAIREYHAGKPDPVAFRRLLQSFIKICETIAYAHSRGVIHRDIKPQNVMLGKFGETIVVDWGLAKVVGRPSEEQEVNREATLRPVGGSDGEGTELGAAVGTPAYMSPEQAAGRWDVIDPTSDVYSLGAVLYVILTGRPSLEGGNWPELQQKIQRGDYPRPRETRKSTPRALEAICLKAMALNPEDRYPSARALATEVELWMADEPVRAYREPFAVRLGRWARHHKPTVAASIALVTTAIIAVAISVWFISLERKVYAQTEAERKSYMTFYFAVQDEANSLKKRLAELQIPKKTPGEK